MLLVYYSHRGLQGGFWGALNFFWQIMKRLKHTSWVWWAPVCFTQSRWIKPSPVPPVHQPCPEHQSQACGEGKVLCNRRGKIIVATLRFLCLLLLLLLLPSQLMRCLCQPPGRWGLLATRTLLPAAEPDRQDRGREAHPWREGREKGGGEEAEGQNYTPKHPWTLQHSTIASFLLLFKVS